MSDLQIPFEVLETFSTEIESVRNRMNATGHTFENYEDDMGDDSVRDALTDFVDNWRDGRKEIDGQLTALKEIADGVVTGFTDLDQGYADNLRSSGGEGGGGGEQQPV